MAEFELTLNSPITEEQWDAITDVDFDCTNRIWFHTKHGKTVEFIKAEPPTITAAPPATNADRIRAMSDEELAEFIGGIYTLEIDAWGDYDPCVVVEQSVKIRDKEDMLNWLRSPAGGEK